MDFNDYVWGSHSVACNYAINLAYAHFITKDSSYYNGVLDTIHWLLGVNYHNKCFITGCGSNPPMNIHHRPSIADGIINPVPGFIPGGPNYNLEDWVLWNNFNPSDPPAICWVDNKDSYAGNEVTINWNAPLVFILSYVSDFFSGISVKTLVADTTETVKEIIPDVRAYPNYLPAGVNKTEIWFNNVKAGDVTIEICNEFGKVIWSKTKYYLQGMQKEDWIKPRDAGSGVYIIYAKMNGIIKKGKLIIVR